MIVGCRNGGLGRAGYIALLMGDANDILLSGAVFGGEACDSRVRCMGSHDLDGETCTWMSQMCKHAIFTYVGRC
jgi:hypothetical protein